MLFYFLLGFPLGLSGLGTPGPTQAYLLAQSIKNGWLRTLPAVLAPLISDGPIILVMVVLLTQLPLWVLSLIKLAGGLFLVYLAWAAYRTFRTFDFVAQAEAGPDAANQSVWQAALVNALSPGPWIYWSSISGPVLVEGWRESPAHGIGFLLGFYLALIGGLAGLVVLFGVARRAGPSVGRALTGISALLMLGFGIYQLWSGIGDFLA